MDGRKNRWEGRKREGGWEGEKRGRKKEKEGQREKKGKKGIKNKIIVLSFDDQNELSQKVLPVSLMCCSL